MNNTSTTQDRTVFGFKDTLEQLKLLDFNEIQDVIEDLDVQIDALREEKDKEIAALEQRVSDLEAEIDDLKTGFEM